MKQIAVIGAGLGGLAAAITIAHAGHKVTVFEKNAQLGGKMRAVQLGQHHFDFGPNTITMRAVFQRVLEQTGVKANDYLQFVRLPIHMKNVSANGEVFYFSSNQQQMIKQMARFSAEDAHNYPAFITEISRIYFLAQRHFLQATFTSWRDYVKPSLLGALLRVRPFQTLAEFITHYFRHPFIVQSFLRYATYIGSSPYEMPATFAMIAYLELVDGVDYVKGGTSSIAKAFVRRATELGVTFRTNCEITEIKEQRNRVTYLVDHMGQHYSVDAVFMNGDYLTNQLQHINKQSVQPSSSAFVLLLGLNRPLENSHHHSVYFPQHYGYEFEALFSERYIDEPTIYICNSSVTDPSISPRGANLLVLVNAPPTINGELQVDAMYYRQQILAMLKRQGLDIERNIVEEKMITPQFLESEFYAYRGALYGAASNTFSTAFFRPANRQRLKNMYYVGGTVHPGGGSPLVTLGGMNVANAFLRQMKTL